MINNSYKKKIRRILMQLSNWKFGFNFNLIKLFEV